MQTSQGDLSGQLAGSVLVHLIPIRRDRRKNLGWDDQFSV